MIILKLRRSASTLSMSPSLENLENDCNSSTTATGTSSSSSRLRRLDKLVIDQSSLLDEDDQIEYINQLNRHNLNRFNKNRKLTTYFYIFQIVAIILVNFTNTDVHDKSLLLLTLISVLLNIITIQDLQQKYHYEMTIFGKTFDLVLIISLINILVSIEVIYIDLFKVKVYYFAALVVCNYLLPKMHQSTYNEIGASVKELDKLKYKYKNV